MSWSVPTSNFGPSSPDGEPLVEGPELEELDPEVALSAPVVAIEVEPMPVVAVVVSAPLVGPTVVVIEPKVDCSGRCSSPVHPERPRATTVDKTPKE